MTNKTRSKKAQDSPEDAAKKLQQIKRVEDVYKSVNVHTRLVASSIVHLVDSRNDLRETLIEESVDLDDIELLKRRFPRFADLNTLIADSSEFTLLMPEFEAEFRQQWKTVKKQDVAKREVFLEAKEKALKALLDEADEKSRMGFDKVGIVAGEQGLEWIPTEKLKEREREREREKEEKEKEKGKEKEEKKKGEEGGKLRIVGNLES